VRKVGGWGGGGGWEGGWLIGGMGWWLQRGYIPKISSRNKIIRKSRSIRDGRLARVKRLQKTSLKSLSIAGDRRSFPHKKSREGVGSHEEGANSSTGNERNAGQERGNGGVGAALSEKGAEAVRDLRQRDSLLERKETPPHTLRKRCAHPDP